jgi:hypothetical protein
MLDRIDHAIADRLPNDAAGPLETRFNVPARYNASEILFRNQKSRHMGWSEFDSLLLHVALAHWAQAWI